MSDYPGKNRDVGEVGEWHSPTNINRGSSLFFLLSRLLFALLFVSLSGSFSGFVGFDRSEAFFFFFFF
ncbi:MAG: hypothetical protein ACO3NK_11140 [Prochlorotrichaceae cyanobacterium]